MALRRYLPLAFVFLAACRPASVEKTPPPSDPVTAASAPVAAPTAPPDGAATALAARCDQYQKLLSSTPYPYGVPGFPDETISGGWDHPAHPRSRPIPRDDDVYGAVGLPRFDDPLPPGLARKKFVYVDTTGSGTVADLRSLAELLRGVELRIIVAKSGDERVAQHVAMFPFTPPALRATLANMHSLDDSAGELVRMGGLLCPDLFGVFRALTDGRTIDALGPLTAEALRKCNCRVADLDGYVSLLGWTWLAAPHIGYLPLDRNALATARADMKLAEFVAALP